MNMNDLYLFRVCVDVKFPALLHHPEQKNQALGIYREPGWLFFDFSLRESGAFLSASEQCLEAFIRADGIEVMVPVHPIETGLVAF